MGAAGIRQVVGLIGGILSGGALGKAYELSHGGDSQLSTPLLLVGLGVGLMVAALVRD